MQLISASAYCDLVAGSRLLEWDEGDKVLERDGRIVKLFRIRWRASRSLVDPPSRRFAAHGRRLRALNVRAPETEAHFLCWKIRRFGVVYRRLPGQDVSALAAAGRFDAARVAALGEFIAELHERGVLFRSLHPQNILLLPDDGFALIDIADMRIRHRPLTSAERVRNFAHLRRRPAHRELWARLGWATLLRGYGKRCALAAPAREALLERVARMGRESPARQADGGPGRLIRKVGLELEAPGAQTLPLPPARTAERAPHRRHRETRLRLLIVTDAWFPQINGVVRTLSTTREKLMELGHRVDVLAPDRFRSIPCPTYPEIRLALCTPGRVGRLISELDPHAVHVATEGPLGWAARSWLRRRRLPFTSSFHTMFPAYLKLRFGVPEKVSFSGIRRFHGGANATMYSTPTLKAMLEAQGFGNLVRWVRGVDTEIFTPGEAEPLPFERPIQLYVGRVAVEKSVEDFLSLNTPGTKVVVGDGPQRRELQQRYPAVRFLGTRRDEELVRHYRAADVFVFPSRTETLGLVMLEALACGVPVAAYPVQGPLDVVADSGAGVLDEDLAAAVAAAIGIDPERCRARAMEHSWDRSVWEFLNNLVPFRASGLEGETA